MQFIIVYQKTGALRYLGHLDFQNLWERLLRISQLPIAFSEGFHPTMKMNLLQPLSVGMEALHEYLHLSLNEKRTAENIYDSLINILPEGLHILKVSPTKWTAKQFHQRKASMVLLCTFSQNVTIQDSLLAPPIMNIREITPITFRVEIENTSQIQTNFSRLLLTRAPSIDILKLTRVRLTYR